MAIYGGYNPLGGSEFFRRLPNIADLYTDASWLFDLIIITAVLSLIFRYGAERIFARGATTPALGGARGHFPYATRIGTVLGLASGFLITVWLQQTNQTLVEYMGPYVTLLIMLAGFLFWRFLNELTQGTPVNQWHTGVIAFILTMIFLILALSSAYSADTAVQDMITLAFWAFLILLLLGTSGAIAINRWGTPTPPFTPVNINPAWNARQQRAAQLINRLIGQINRLYRLLP
ncbi:hypothetical protein HY486_03900 [Candidatus Woesearchaeota archaeon]|nr:hypothetical protein [Candidatus Woesearchaeota archaeon]